MRLGSRYDRFENPGDLQREIEYCEQIVAATPRPGLGWRPGWLTGWMTGIMRIKKLSTPSGPSYTARRRWY